MILIILYPSLSPKRSYDMYKSTIELVQVQVPYQSYSTASFSHVNRSSHTSHSATVAMMLSCYGNRSQITDHRSQMMQGTYVILIVGSQAGESGNLDLVSGYVDIKHACKDNGEIGRLLVDLDRAIPQVV